MVSACNNSSVFSWNHGSLWPALLKTLSYFMLISPCIVNQFWKCSNKMTIFCTVFYSLQTALHVSGETFTHHQELE
jgi:hypothetical protein